MRIVSLVSHDQGLMGNCLPSVLAEGGAVNWAFNPEGLPRRSPAELGGFGHFLLGFHSC